MQIADSCSTRQPAVGTLALLGHIFFDMRVNLELALTLELRAA